MMCFSPQRRNKCNEEMSHRRLLIDHGDSTSNVEKLLRGQQFLTFWLHDWLFATAAEQMPQLFWTFSLPNVLFATALYNFATSELTKVVQTRHVLCIFTSQCAFRHRVVQFCNIRTYKSGPNTSCFVHFHFPMCFSPQGRTILQHQNVQKWSKHVMFCAFSLPNVFFATGACIFSTSELTKVVQTRHVLCIFTSECTFRHSGVSFFDISTYKSAPNTSCFVHFHCHMCFSPQRRTIFRHRNFKKCFGADVFCTFSLENVLFATAACNFWFLLWPHDSAPAALTDLLLDWPDTRIIEKTQHFATSLTFRADVSSFF